MKHNRSILAIALVAVMMTGCNPQMMGRNSAQKGADSSQNNGTDGQYYIGSSASQAVTPADVPDNQAPSAPQLEPTRFSDPQPAASQSGGGQTEQSTAAGQASQPTPDTQPTTIAQATPAGPSAQATASAPINNSAATPAPSEKTETASEPADASASAPAPSAEPASTTTP